VIAAMMENTMRPGAGIIASLIALGLVFFGASNLFFQLTDTIRTIWGVRIEGGAVRSFIVGRIIAFVTVLGFGALLIGWIVLDTWLQIVATNAGGIPGMRYISLVGAMLFLTLLCAVSYKAFPKGKAQWHDVWLGAAVGGVGIALAKYLLSLYFSNVNVAGAYGPAGSIVIVLLWIYYTSQIYFFGAEVVYSYTHLYGSRRNEEEDKGPAYS
jgi:membrane protein